MIDLGLSQDELALYEADLALSHSIRVVIHILDRNEKHQGSLTVAENNLIEGEVTVDARADITRSLGLTIVDKRNRIDLDPTSPSEEALFIDTFIAVEREDYSQSLDGYVSCPVFWGPLTGFERDGHTVRLEGLGKEVLSLDPHLLFTIKNFRKEIKIREAIERLLREQGERRFDFPDFDRKLHKNISVNRMEEPWRRCTKLAQSMNCQLFYDGRGKARLRRHPHDTNEIYIFREEDGKKADKKGVILDTPVLTYDFDRVRNVVEVVGPKPQKKDKKRIRYVARPSKKHPLHPDALARNGEPRLMVHRIQNEHIKRESEAREIAERALKGRLRSSLNVSFTSLPIPHLEERDHSVLLRANGDRIPFHMDQYSIPLTADDPMSVGALKHKTWRKRRAKHN